MSRCSTASLSTSSTSRWARLSSLALLRQDQAAWPRPGSYWRRCWPRRSSSSGRLIRTSPRPARTWPPCFGGVAAGASLAAALADLGQRLGEDLRPVLLGAALLDVGEVRLVRLGAQPAGRVLPVQARGLTTARAVPRLRRRRLGRELDLACVPGRAEVDHLPARGGFAALVGAHRAGPDATAADRTATGHGRHSCLEGRW